jgi:methyl-accepting chemotaxis protein
MALAAGAYEVFRNQPDKSFQLLQVWGPAFLVALVGIYVYGRITESQIQATRESFGELAASIRGAVEASAQTAAAMNRMAEVSGETNRETQRLAMFAAQQGQEITDRLDRQDEVLSEIMHSMKGVHSMLSKEKAALDAKEKEIGGTV